MKKLVFILFLTILTVLGCGEQEEKSKPEITKKHLTTDSSKISYGIGLDMGQNLRAQNVTINNKELFRGLDHGFNRNSQFLPDSVLQEEISKMNYDNDTLRISYGIGYNMGQNMRVQYIPANLDIFEKGFEDGYNGITPLLTNLELQEAKRNYDRDRLKRVKGFSKVAQLNKEVGEAFLKQNAEKRDVEILPSGLQYKIISEGSGATPKEKQYVKIHYIAKFVDGTEFENTYQKGNARIVPVDQLVKGWTEGLLNMKEGAKWVLYIPDFLGYGEEGNGNDIGPNVTFILELELIEIIDKL